MKSQKREKLHEYFISLDDIVKSSNINIYANTLMPTLHDEFFHKLYDFKTSNTIEYNNNLKALFDNISLNLTKTYILTHTDELKLGYLEEILNYRK